MIKNLEDAFRRVKREESRRGQLQAKAGIGLTLAMQDAYQRWKEKPTKGNRTKYMKLRLALHLNWNGEKDFLRELNDLCGLGLNDENIGKTFWEVEPRVKGVLKNQLHKSGEGLKGASSPGSQITTTKVPDGEETPMKLHSPPPDSDP